MKKITVGLLAHVDAGKTTLGEALLYSCGNIRTLGRVDSRNTFLDTQTLERERGITIFSKQAVLSHGDCELILLDTPGHVDFSCEMERTLQVLDYAVLIISGTSGVQGHTHTLWQLLRRYRIPTFIFVNKMDLETADRQVLLSRLQTTFGSGVVDFSADDREEALAVLDDALTEKYLQNGKLDTKDIAALISSRKAFACFFGSALKLTGIEEFLDALCTYTERAKYPDVFGARVYKIARDENGERPTFLKITGGALRVKTVLSGADWEEKVNQIRIYSGEKFRFSETVQAGMVCAVTGLTHTLPGDGLGLEAGREEPLLRPVLEYRIETTDGTDLKTAYSMLRQLQEEDPQLHLSWQNRELKVGLMGEVQMQVLQRLIQDRFSLNVRFDEGRIIYRETIAEAVEGVGHFEPLRHYAEVHLLLEPSERGSGLHFDTVCSEDTLSRNWQRLILTHLMEKQHLGVLTGSPITDLRITLLCGKAHIKHTEGGDFRQATYRAVRQGLRKAKSVLLEPWYSFTLTVPQEAAGRALSDLDRMQAVFSPLQITGELAQIRGSASVRKMRGYAQTISSYTHGMGKLALSPDGYRPCTDQETVVCETAYDPEHDLENPTGSVFCGHGAGFDVAWNEVDAYSHLPLIRNETQKPQTVVKSVPAVGGGTQLDQELQRIFERTYGAIRRKDILPTDLYADDKHELISHIEDAQEYVLVDGYNIIFAWDELKEISKDNLDAARYILMNRLCNYQAFRGCALILVFDAYRVPEGLGSVEKYHNIYIVYTKQAETADQYIERVTYELGKHRKVRVATSDRLEQLIIVGHGAERISAQNFYDEVQSVHAQIRKLVQENNRKNNES